MYWFLPLTRGHPSWKATLFLVQRGGTTKGGHSSLFAWYCFHTDTGLIISGLLTEHIGEDFVHLVGEEGLAQRGEVVGYHGEDVPLEPRVFRQVLLHLLRPWWSRDEHVLSFHFPWLTMPPPRLQFVSSIAKCNIDNSYPLTKFGNKMCKVYIF